MTYNLIDELFFDAILFFKDIIEKGHDETFKMDFNYKKALLQDGLIEVTYKNKTESKKFFNIGNYDSASETFKWFEPTRKLIHSLLFPEGSDGDFFGFKNSIEKLLAKNEIKLGKEYKNLIPYLVVIIMHPYNILRMQDPDNLGKYNYIAIDLGLTKSLLQDFANKMKDFSKIVDESGTRLFASNIPAMQRSKTSKRKSSKTKKTSKKKDKKKGIK